jgi:hypothetical protein
MNNMKTMVGIATKDAPTSAGAPDELRLGGSCAPGVYAKPIEPGNLAISSMLRPVLARQERQRGRKLQTPTFRDKRALQPTCIEACMKARMIVENCELKLLRPMPLARLCVSAALLSTTATPAFPSQGTPEQRLACTPDVFRLCSAFIPDADEISICLKEKYANLSDACRAALDAGGKQPPNADDGAQSRKRSAK